MNRPATKQTKQMPLARFSGPLLLVGAGKMGSAMLAGWIARGLAAKRIAVIEVQPAKSIKALARRGLKLNPKGKTAEASAIVIAVKPQTAPEAVPPLAAYIGKSTLVLSIMAGRTLRFLEQSLPAGVAIVRAMPNTPAAIGRGISVAVANAKASARQRKLAGDLLAAIGKVEWVGDETLMDAVTALSGSGPAYVFLLAEAMTKAGIAAGLPADLAARLARETVAGSGDLLHRSDHDAAMLRQNVTSPGGTTAAALEVLTGPGGFDELLTRAIAAATRRSRELAG
jgi:pyrroline-5-carboxylate reductase